MRKMGKREWGDIDVSVGLLWSCVYKSFSGHALIKLSAGYR